MATVNEGSSSDHVFGFYSDEEATIPVIPESVEYRLMANSEVEIIGWTEIPSNDLSTEVAIVIPSAANTLSRVDKKRGLNKRYLTVKAEHSGGKIITGEASWEIRDLAGIYP